MDDFETEIEKYMTKIVNPRTNEVSYQLNKRIHHFTIDVYNPKQPYKKATHGRKIFTPTKIYDNAAECARVLQVSRTTVHNRCIKNIDGFRYIENDNE